MATKVQIELSVDESGGIAGLRAFETQVDKTASKIHLVGDAGDAAGRKVHRMGDDGADAHDKLGKHALNAHDKLRIMERTLGVDIPKSFGKVILQSELAMRGISALSGVMIGIGGIQIFAATAKEAYEFYEKMTDVNEAMREFTTEAAKSAQQKLFSSASVESLDSMIAQEEQRIEKIKGLQKIAGVNDAGHGSLTQYFPSIMSGVAYGLEQHGIAAPTNFGSRIVYSSNDDKVRAQHSANIEGIEDLKQKRDRQSELQRAESIAQFNTSIARPYAQPSAQLSGAIQIAELHRQQAIADEKFQHDRIERDRAEQRRQSPHIAENDPTRIHSYTISPNAGQQQYEEEVANARREASAKRIQLARAENDAITRLRNESTNAMLRGENLYDAQRLQAIEDFKRQYGNSQQGIDAINAKFHSEQMRRIEDENRASLQRAQVASDTGKKGVAGIEARRNERFQEIANTPYSDPENRKRDLESAQTEANAQISTSQKSFNDELDSMDRERTNQQLQGFARLRAETDGLLHDLDKKYEDYYGVAGQRDARYANERAQIMQLQAKQEADLARTNADETRRLEEEAYRTNLSPMRAQSQQIYDEYNERLRNYQEMLEKEQISQEDFNRRVAAANADLHGKLQQQTRQMRDKLASELQGFFSNPLEELKHKGEEAAAKAAASLIMKVGGKNTSLSGKENEGFLGIQGLPSFGRKHNTQDVAAPGWGATHSASPMSVTSATIYVTGQASIYGGSKGLMAAASGTNLLNPSFAPGSPSSFGSPSKTIETQSSDLSGLQVGGTRSMQNLPFTSSDGSGTSGSSVGMIGQGSSLGKIETQSSGPSGLQVGGSPSMPNLSSSSSAGRSTSESSTGMIGQGMSLGKDVAGLFKKSKKSTGADESLEVKSVDLSNLKIGDDKNKGMLNGGGFKSNVSGAASGATGLYSAYAGNGGVGGAMSGAMSGMQLGSSLGIPGGAVIGAAAGAALGFIGFGGRAKAEKYYNNQVKPRILDDEKAYDAGSSDYLTAYSDMESLQGEAKQTVKQWGSGASSYYESTIKKAITQAEQKLSREQKSGRSAVTMSAAQYHTGYEVDSFGDMATSADEGFIHAQIGEYIVKPNVAARNRSALDSLQAGATMEQVSSSYRQTMQNASQQRSNAGDRTLNMHIYAHDSKSVARMLSENKHVLRSALNDANGEYGGRADG